MTFNQILFPEVCRWSRNPRGISGLLAIMAPDPNSDCALFRDGQKKAQSDFDGAVACCSGFLRAGYPANSFAVTEFSRWHFSLPANNRVVGFLQVAGRESFLAFLASGV